MHLLGPPEVHDGRLDLQPRDTAAGSTSASVDGEIVNPGSGAARELASELSQLPEQYRPDEIGSPWPISGPGYFTDAGHQDHLHLGFKKEIDPSWSPPGDVAAKGGAPAVAAAAPVAPVAPAADAAAVPAAPAAPAAAAPAAPAAAAAAAPPEAPKAGASGQFRAVSAEAAGARKGGLRHVHGRAAAGRPAERGGPPASVPGMVDAAAAAAPGRAGAASARPR